MVVMSPIMRSTLFGNAIPAFWIIANRFSRAVIRVGISESSVLTKPQPAVMTAKASKLRKPPILEITP